MKFEFRRFSYKCRCGYVVNVFVDCGTPQDVLKCRKCACEIKRTDGC